MSTTIRNSAGDKPDDRDVLLPRDLPHSIVDSLFAIPETAAEEATALDRAVVSRLQQAVADKMRSIVRSDERHAA